MPDPLFSPHRDVWGGQSGNAGTSGDHSGGALAPHRPAQGDVQSPDSRHAGPLGLPGRCHRPSQAAADFHRARGG
eukprot:2037715-Alexandrium_andersonii.AAC.1